MNTTEESTQEDASLSQDKQTSEGQKNSQAVGLQEADVVNLVQKTIQSINDKRFAKVEKTQEAQKSQLDRVLEKIQAGVEPDAARQSVELEDTVAYVQSLQSGGGEIGSEPTSSSANQEASSLNLVEAMTSTGHNPASPGAEVMEIINGFEGTQAELQNKLVLMRGSQSTKPASIGAVTTPTGSTPGVGNLSLDDAKNGLANMQNTVPFSQRTEAQQEQADTYMAVIEEAEKN